MNAGAPADQATRHTAVHGHGSYIVQAPAGSGKTELLVSRYLRLLGQVERPEAILAITFTNKAAAEMRNRILAALDASSGPRPEASHRAAAYDLARTAAAADAAHGWRLRESPRRVRVQTIDSLCAELTRLMPLLSGLGATPATLERAEVLYEHAVEQLLAHIEDVDFGTDVAVVLTHVGGSARRLLRQLIAALARREQWIRHVVRGEAAERRELEAALERLVDAELSVCASALPAELLVTMTTLGARAAALRTAVVGDPGSLAALVERRDPPRPQHTDLSVWAALASFVLTTKGEVRVRVTKNEGVPAKGAARDAEEGRTFAAHREAVTELLARLSRSAATVEALRRAAALPDPAYTDSQWQALSALLRVLKLVVAHLKVIYAETGQVDFSEVQTRALTALGHEQAPTELMLAMDQRLKHILVDEFQDTSHSQMQLLRTLCSGWQPGDGCSLFLVGDPMQSIYRFREAEVGYFLQTRVHGLGDVALEPLTLKTNFRSVAPVVEWVNACFASVFPRHDDPRAGAVSYAHATAAHTAAAAPHAGVHVHPQLGADPVQEAGTVAELVRGALDASDRTRIAVLVRARSHLPALLPALRAANIRFRAVDAEPLAGRPVIQDLYALTRALVHAADAVAWLAILRAPWCGLTLRDLQAVFAGREPWPQRLARGGPWPGLSTDGSTRLERVLQLVTAARSERRARGLHETVEALWFALGGPQVLAQASDLTDARTFLELLASHERAGDLRRRGDFEGALRSLYAAADSGAGDRVQLMTMHKAKGLEFDVVILPSLGRSARADDRRLLAATEVPTAHGDADLLLAPIDAPGESDRLFSYLTQLERTRVEHETLRLVYVAATRAIAQLHLVGHCEADADGHAAKAPARDSLLAALWPAVHQSFDAVVAAADEATPPAQVVTAPAVSAPLDPPSPALRRVPSAWSTTPPAAILAASQPARTTSPQEVTLEFEWVGETARHVGTLVHRWLERFARDGLERWTAATLARRLPQFRTALANLGVPKFELETAAARVLAALSSVLGDARARWLMQPRAGADAELALGTLRGASAARFVVDRTFVDEQGVRWIIDYKTGSHEGGDVDSFLDTEQERYQAQLENYAALLNAIEPRTTRLGLYFPLMGAWREWAAPEPSSPREAL